LDAWAISPEESILIASVQEYANKEARHIGEKRRADGVDTLKGAKKAKAVTIPEDIARTLKEQPDMPRGRRDNLIMCLLLDYGLRVSEIVIRSRKDFDIKAGTFTFFWVLKRTRPKRTK
jgi:integrase